MKISYVYIMCFDPVHPLSLPSTPSLSATISLPTSCALSLYIFFLTCWVYLVLPLCSWVGDHLPEHGRLPVPTSSRKTTPPPCTHSSHQWPIASQLGMGLQEPLPFHSGIWAGLISRRYYSCSHSCCESMHVMDSSCSASKFYHRHPPPLAPKISLAPPISDDHFYLAFIVGPSCLHFSHPQH